MKNKIANCDKCGKEIKLYYTGAHESYSMKKGKYLCGGCM